MADAAIVLILLAGIVSGLRRGFVKEALSVLGILVATYVAVQTYAAAGPFAAENLRLPADVGYMVGGIASWIVAYFLFIFLGRLAWKSIRGQGPMSRVEKAAGGAADHAAGKTGPGPITLFLRPLPTQAGILYWFDKVLGGLLGLAQAALLILLALFAASSLPLGKTGATIRRSHMYGVFQADLEPELSKMPEVRIARSIGDLAHVLEDIQEKPERADTFRKHKALAPLRDYKPVQDLADDHDFKVAVEGKHYGEVLRNPKVLSLLKDREFRRRLAEVDWQQVDRDLEADEKAEAKPAPAPPPPPPPPAKKSSSGPGGPGGPGAPK